MPTGDGTPYFTQFHYTDDTGCKCPKLGTPSAAAAPPEQLAT